jgi:hypothetical protein
MGGPLDFDDDRIRCDRCGTVLPADQALRACRITSWEQSNLLYRFGSSTTFSLTVCPACHRRIRWGQRLRLVGKATLALGFLGLLAFLIWFLASR